jgi:hypothetical protein
MLGFAGVMEIELRDFGAEEVVVEVPQPVINIKATGRAEKIS